MKVNKSVKFLALSAILLAFIAGCATGPQVTVNPNTEALQDLSVKIAARQLGYMLGQKNQGKIDQFAGYCDEFLKVDANVSSLFISLINALDLQVKTYPLLKPDLEDLLTALDIKIMGDSIPLTDRQRYLIKLGVSTFREGLMFAKGA